MKIGTTILAFNSALLITACSPEPAPDNSNVTATETPQAAMTPNMGAAGDTVKTSPAKGDLTTAALTGLWAPQDVGCASGLFVDLKQNGDFATFESVGTWTTDGARLRFATTKEGSPPDPKTPVVPARINYVQITEVKSDSTRWNGDTDYAETMIRCPARS